MKYGVSYFKITKGVNRNMTTKAKTPAERVQEIFRYLATGQGEPPVLLAPFEDKKTDRPAQGKCQKNPRESKN